MRISEFSEAQHSISIISVIIAISAGIAGAFVYYCEKLQLLPLTAKGLIGRLGIAAIGCGVLFFLLFFLLRKALRRLSKKEWIPFLLSALILSVCVMVWFPMPDTGLFRDHDLTIRAVPNDRGDFRPVTMTWFHRANGDIPLSSVHCEGNCLWEDNRLILSDENAILSWHGKTGELITLEFRSGTDQGIAEIVWDDVSQTAALDNEDFSLLSFDHIFSPSDGLPEFIAVWWLCFLLSFAGVLAAVKLLPEWDMRIFAAAAFLVFVIFRIVQFRTVTSALTFVDSEFYLGQSRFSLADLLAGKKYCRIDEWHCLSRPLLIPLIYKLCRQDLNTIAAVQLVISLLSWGYFARQAAALCRNNMTQKLTLIFSLGLGCIPNVTRWDQMIMSESISISMSVLLMGSLFWLTRPEKDKKWHWLPAICTAVSALLFASSRDSAVWTILPVVILLLCIARLRSGKKVLLLLAAILSGICIISMSSTGDRWVYSYENVLFTRILREPKGESFFIEAGMPTPSGIEEFYGVEHAMTYPLFNSDEFKPLRDWILSDGLKTYVRYMLHVPSETLRMTWYEGFETEAFEKISYTFTPFGFKNLLPDPVIKLFSCNLPGVLVIVLAFAGIISAFRSSSGERYAFPLLFILSAYLLSTAVFIADAYELDRHIIGIVIMMKASIFPLIAMLRENVSSKQ